MASQTLAFSQLTYIQLHRINQEHLFSARNKDKQQIIATKIHRVGDLLLLLNKKEDGNGIDVE